VEDFEVEDFEVEDLEVEDLSHLYESISTLGLTLETQRDYVPWKSTGKGSLSILTVSC
jgi:hypothetical protein